MNFNWEFPEKQRNNTLSFFLVFFDAVPVISESKLDILVELS
jgi:hypothetical protein